MVPLLHGSLWLVSILLLNTHFIIPHAVFRSKDKENIIALLLLLTVKHL